MQKSASSSVSFPEVLFWLGGKLEKPIISRWFPANRPASLSRTLACVFPYFQIVSEPPKNNNDDNDNVNEYLLTANIISNLLTFSKHNSGELWRGAPLHVWTWKESFVNKFWFWIYSVGNKPLLRNTWSLARVLLSCALAPSIGGMLLLSATQCTREIKSWRFGPSQSYFAL